MTALSLFKKISISFQKFILDTLFPITCLSCQKPDIWLCPSCLHKIEILTTQVCPYCEKNITPAGHICLPCKINFLKKNQSPPLDNLLVATSYIKHNIAHLVHLYKYNFVTDLSVPLAQLLIKALLQNNLPLPDLIIPVPLHPRRLRWRGFNQATLLANYTGRNLTPNFPIPVLDNLIIRQKYTPPQMKIKNYHQRKKNIAGIFTFSTSHQKKIKDKTILLVDDICTTGSTLLECGKILKKNGARSVFGIVIARQTFKTTSSLIHK